MRFLICAAGSRGDLHPLLALADALAHKGHDVRVLLNPYYQNIVRTPGVTFVPVGLSEEMETLYSCPEAATYQHGWKHWIRTCGVQPMPALYDAVKKNYVPGDTVAIGNYLSFGARVAQDHFGVPLATVHMDAHTIRSKREVLALPFPGMTGPLVPEWYQPIQFRIIDRFWTDPIVTPKLNAFRKELQLPSVRRIAHTWWHSPQLTIGLFPDWWSAPQPDWPSKCVTSDFLFWDEGNHAALPEDVLQFALAGSAPIVFTPGNSAMHTSRYFAAAVETCQQLGQRGIIITDRTDLLPPLPETVRSYRYLPFQPLLRHASLVVHHAGVGTSAQCIAAGLPQVVIPTLYNQPDTAKRLERLGISRTIQSTKVNGRTLSAAVKAMMTDQRVRERCQELAGRIDLNRGIDLTIQLVEALGATANVSMAATI